MSKYFILSLILIFSFVVRLYKINSPLADWHSWRQVDTAAVTKNLINSNYDILHPKYEDISSIQTGYFNPKGYRFVEFPIYNLAHAKFHLLFPNLSFETSGRLTSIFSAILTITFLFILGEEIIGSWGGILAAFFYGFIPFNIYFTRVILPDPMATMFATGSIVFFYFYTKNENIIQLLLSAIFFSLAMLVKPFALFYAIPIAYLYLKKFGFKNAFKNLPSWQAGIPALLALDIALIPFLLWRVWLNQKDYFVGIPHMSWAFNNDHIRFKPSFFKWIFSERLGKLILGTWGIFPFAVGITSQKGKSILINFILLGSFLYVTIIATANVRHDYYQTFIIPGVALALAQGGISLWHKKSNKLQARSLFIFSVFMILLIGTYEIIGNFNINHPEIVKAGQEADKILPKNALVIAPYNGDSTFLYQTNRSGWPVINESVNGMIEKGADYYISVNYDDDTNNLLKIYKTIEKTPEYIILDLHEKI